MYVHAYMHRYLVGFQRDEEAKVYALASICYHACNMSCNYTCPALEKVWTTSLNFWCLNPAVVRDGQ